MSRLTRLSLANRTVVLLLALLVVITGVASARALKQELIPSTNWPASTIISIYPGASPTSVEADVSKPIEDAVKAVDHVKTVTSISSSNTSQVTVEWEWGVDTDKIMSDIRAAVDSVDLPDNVDPKVSSGSFDDLPILIVAVSSDASPETLSKQAKDVVVPALKDVKGVQDVSVAGDEQREIDITFDVAETNRLNVDPSSIRQLFAANSKAFPSGTMRTDTADLDVQTGRTYETVEQIEDLKVQGEDDPVRLGDIATVEERPTDSTSVSRVNGKDAVTLAIKKTADANTVAVTQGVNARLDKLAKELGDDTQFNATFDQAPFIQQSIHDLTVEGAIGLLMAVLIILLFLRSLAPTFIAGVSIPLSLLFAMTGLLVGGYTLNIFTLGALTVAIGRVVDDSIVVIENIKRHQGLGETGVGTLVRSVKEVAGAVTSSTLTTVAVFAPIGMVGGQAGSFFRPFALTVVISLLASLFVSLTVVPVLASYIMQRRTSVAQIQAQAHDEADGWLQHAYLPVLRWTLRSWPTRVFTLVLAVLIFFGTMAMTPYLKTDFIGAGSAVNLQVIETLPAGTSLTETSAAARRVEDVIRRDPNLGTYSTEIAGGSSVFIAVQNDSNKASITVLLTPGVDPVKSARKLRANLAKLHDVGRLEVAVGDSETANKVVLYVESPDQYKLAGATEKTLRMMRGIKGLTNVTSDLGEKRRMLDVNVDDQKAAEHGMTQASIGEAVSWAVRGEKIGEVTENDTTRDVYLRSQEPAKDLADLRDLVLPTSQKMTVDTRKDAGDVLKDRGNALKDKQEADARKDYRDGLDKLKDQQDESENSAVELRQQLQLANEQLAALQAQRAANPNSPNVTHMDQQISDLQAQVAQLSVGLAGAEEGADGIDEQISEMRDNWKKSQRTQDKADAISDASDNIDDLLAKPVLLSDVAQVDTKRAASSITRVEAKRAVTISASSDGNDLSAITAAIKAGIPKLNLGDGVSVRLGGVSEQQQQSFGQLGAAMMVAIGIVYLIMVATFGSLIQPLILLVSIPFAATGALGLSLLTDTAVGIPSMIGMLMLIGIVVTNAIVLIDLINQKRTSGSTIEESIMAGARLRVRPIVMTALATISALLPMALGITGGGVFISKPLAIIVIGGLISSSMLTLILVPVLYDIVEHRPDWLRFGKKQPPA
ncbi:MAG: efflux RND transporter permease subunit [Aeromicrobium sp.]